MTGWWKRLRAVGRCPGCPEEHYGPQVYCRKCRVKQSRKAARWYRQHVARPVSPWQALRAVAQGRQRNACGQFVRSQGHV
jgi:hypothetical protein